MQRLLNILLTHALNMSHVTHKDAACTCTTNSKFTMPMGFQNISACD